MVYLRAKTVKGEKYLYLVKSVWDSKKNMSRQETIKYLGKASDITKDDIPADYRNDDKIISYLSSIDTVSIAEKEELLTKLKNQLFDLLIKGDYDAVRQLYDNYVSNSDSASFFEKILTPVMYRIGELWANGKLGIADEHVASNIANSLVKMINTKYTDTPTKKKVLICVPEGEEHNLGANILEAHLTNIGHRVFNLTPSIPHESVVKFIESSKPHVVFISITHEDSIKPAQRLAKKITSLSKIPIYVGGQGIKDDTIKFEDAQVIRNLSLKDIGKLLNSKNRI